jgi:hypothetical protein
MTTTTDRDDLFTHIHKALRLGLFELTIAVGRTDWDDPAQVTELGRRWRPLLELLRVHTAHEDDHILRLLDAQDPIAAEPVADEHRDLDDLLDDLAERFEAILTAPNATAGLGLYRDVARFVAGYLPHLHNEETRVMDRIWECCTDEQIATARARFMADTSPDVLATTLEYLLPAIDRATRHALVAGAPPEVRPAVLAIAERVLPPADVAPFRADVPSRV